MKCGKLKAEAQSTEKVTALSLVCLYVILHTDMLILSRRRWVLDNWYFNFAY